MVVCQWVAEARAVGVAMAEVAAQMGSEGMEELVAVWAGLEDRLETTLAFRTRGSRWPWHRYTAHRCCGKAGKSARGQSDRQTFALGTHRHTTGRVNRGQWRMTCNWRERPHTLRSCYCTRGILLSQIVQSRT